MFLLLNPYSLLKVSSLIFPLQNPSFDIGNSSSGINIQDNLGVPAVKAPILLLVTCIKEGINVASGALDALFYSNQINMKP